VNTESMYLLLKHAFDDKGYRRVEWKCHVLNEASRRAALRLGFSFEGVSRQHYLTKGRNRDTAWFGMLDRDWPIVKANMERWLYSEGEQASLAALNSPVLRTVQAPLGMSPSWISFRTLPFEADPRFPDLAVGLPAERPSSGEAQSASSTGRFVRLEPLELERHAEALFSISHSTPESEGLWTYAVGGPFLRQVEFHAFLQREASTSFVILGQESAIPLGLATFRGAKPVMCTVEVGMWLCGSSQGLGATLRPKVQVEAMLLLLRKAFEERGCRRVDWKCDALDRQACSLASYVGFSFEGVHLQHRICKGRNRDTAFFGMLHGDWPHFRANAERWLLCAEDCEVEELGAWNAQRTRQPLDLSGA